METTRPARRGRRERKRIRDPLRLTALLYLREALLRERYEECEELITAALEFGATGTDIRLLLEDARRVPSA